MLGYVVKFVRVANKSQSCGFAVLGYFACHVSLPYSAKTLTLLYFP